MATNIGPRIGIDGEKEYRDAINNLIQQQKTLNAEMKQTAAAFDKSAKASEKNKKQFEILNKEIENQKTYVSQLQSMYDKSAAKYGENATATLKWKQALTEATTELQRMQSQLSDMQGSSSFASTLEGWGKSLQSIGSKMTDVGKGFSTYITGPIAAVGTASIAAFNKVDEGIDTITKKTGATGAQLEEFSEILHQIGHNVPAEFGEIGEAIGEVNTRLGLTGDELQGASEQFLKFAQINDTDITGSIDNAQKAMTAYGVAAEDTGAVLDLLTAVGQATGASVDSLAGGLVSNGAAFRSLGMDISDAAWMLGKLEMSGIDSGKALTGLSKAQAYAAKNGLEMSKVLEKAFSSADAAIEIFGAKAGPQLYEAFQQGLISLEDFEAGTHSLNDSLGLVSETFDATQDPADKLKTIMNDLSWAGADLAEAIFTVAGPALQKLSEWAVKISDAFTGLDDGTKETIVQIAALAAAIGPALVIGGKVIGAIGTIATGASTLIKTFSGLTNGTNIVASAIGFLSSPIGIAVAAIAGIVTAGVLLYKNWDVIKEYATKLGEHIKTTWTNMKTSVSNIWEGIKATISNTITNIKNTVSNTVSSIVSTITSKFNAAKSTVSGIFSGIKSAISNAINGAKSIVEGAVSRIKGVMNFHWSLPRLTLPHISVWWSDLGWGLRIPHLSVSWYKKAYDNAIAFGSPTVVPTASGLKGFGDGRGNEIVIGQNKLLDTFTAAVERAGNTGGTTTISVNVYPSEGMDEEELATLVAERINDSIARAQGVFA